MDLPSNFDESFLDWFREAAEAAWATYQPQTFEDYQARGTGGVDWQTGTRWVGGLTDEEIAAAERRWSLRFPPDYRLFLRILHTVDRPKIGAYYAENGLLEPAERSSFYDWRNTREGPSRLYEDLLSAFEWLFEGLFFDVERNNLWLPSWGEMPATPAGRRERLRALLAAAPKLIPIYQHRYLLAEPHRPGNPVLSIWQSDIVVYGGDLRSYFLWEFAPLLPRDLRYRTRFRDQYFASCNAAYKTAVTVPFWGEIIAHRSKPSA